MAVFVVTRPPLAKPCARRFACRSLPAPAAARSLASLPAAAPQIGGLSGARDGHGSGPALLVCCLLAWCLVCLGGPAAALLGEAARWAMGSETLRRALLSLPVAWVAGFAMGAAGLGGGMLSVNGLVHMPGLKMHQLEAVATSLVAQSTSAVAAGGQWMQSGHVDFKVAACLGLCSLPGVALGAQLAQGLSDWTMRLLCAGVMCLVLCPLAIYQLRASRSQRPGPRGAGGGGALDQAERGVAGSAKPSGGGRALAELRAGLRHCAVGNVAGVLTGLIGMGDTPLMMAYMASLGYSQREVIGTVTVAQAPTMALGAAIHLMAGNAAPFMGLAVATGMSIGATCGAKFMSGSRVDDTALQLVFAASVFAIGGVTAWTLCFA